MKFMALYKQEKKPVSESSSVGDRKFAGACEGSAPIEAKQSLQTATVFPFAVGRPVGGHLLFCFWSMTWGAYHLLKRNIYRDANRWYGRIRIRVLQEPRLVCLASVACGSRKLKFTRMSPRGCASWQDKKLLFEGILPAQAEKEWSGTGPFSLKMANVSALHVFWNDQPVDIAYGARGGINKHSRLRRDDA